MDSVLDQNLKTAAELILFSWIGGAVIIGLIFYILYLIFIK